MLTVVEVPLALGISPPGVDELDDSDAAAKCDGRGLCSGGGPTPLVTGSGGLDGARGRREVNSWDLGGGTEGHTSVNDVVFYFKAASKHAIRLL